ncbi:DUF3592 domain-containing protein [Psychroserpens algicola]|uniref:DUF3592 domain-containing protein n=1 Tax=Psychroserpens algicola TaxID=1719034 RepID=A0ABT0H9W9_9FLAO|nr:DUF3592 domain-containing protein [Psychroserpens algicola]MCK8481191.1 DUF3592 domain-containing protein [Psychroserpens algicola]
MIDYLYAALAIIGFVLLFFAIRSYQNTKELLNFGRKTKAVVIKYIEVYDDDGTTYKPVFEYYDNNKQAFVFESEVSSSPKPYEIGQRVEVIYDKHHENVKVISFWGLYRWSVILLMIASPLLVLGTAYFLYKYN